MSPRRNASDDDPTGEGLAGALARWDTAQEWVRAQQQAGSEQQSEWSEPGGQPHQVEPPAPTSWDAILSAQPSAAQPAAEESSPMSTPPNAVPQPEESPDEGTDPGLLPWEATDGPSDHAADDPADATQQVPPPHPTEQPAPFQPAPPVQGGHPTYPAHPPPWEQPNWGPPPYVPPAPPPVPEQPADPQAAEQTTPPEEPPQQSPGQAPVLWQPQPQPPYPGGWPPQQYQQQYPQPPPQQYPPVPQQYQHPSAPPGPQGAPTVDDLTPQSLLRQRRRPPTTGWRKAVYTMSGHAVNPGESPEDIHRRELTARASVPVHGCYRIAVISLKGGVGKTTMTVCLGATLASLRGDRVIAVDANPDRGTLSGKIPPETMATVRNLLADADQIERYSDVRRYTSQSRDRLEVLASESDPAASIAFSEPDYRVVNSILERFYNVVLTDCGTGLLHSAMAGVLALANQIVLISSGSVDGARSASATLDWLEAHGLRSQVAGSVAVINSVRPKSGGVDLDRLQEHFAARCRAVARIPYDPHLEEGSEVDLSMLRVQTRDALLELAAQVVDGFPRPAGHQQSPYGPGRPF